MSRLPLKTPTFTLEQVMWLDKVFHENTDTKATSDELFINLGSRRVVKRVQNLYEEAKRTASTGG